MDHAAVQDLFRTAMAEDDATAMRQGLELVLGVTEGQGLSADDEYALRRPDFVLEMPQSRERIVGRDPMRAMQEAFPTPPQSVAIHRVFGAGHVWVMQGQLDYGQGPWVVALIMELDDAGLIRKETRYYAEVTDAPEWRAAWVERIDEA